MAGGEGISCSVVVRALERMVASILSEVGATAGLATEE